MNRYVLAFALYATSCAPSQPPAQAEPPFPEVLATAEAPASDAAPSYAPPSERSARLLQVSVRDGAVFFQDQEAGATVPGRMKRLDPLFSFMRSRSPTQNGEPYRLSISGQLDVAQFKSVTQTVAYAGWPDARLDTAGGGVLLHTTRPGRDTSKPYGPTVPGDVLSLVVRSDVVEVWRAPLVTDDGAPTAASLRLDTGRLLEQTLTEECQRSGCNPVIIRAENKGPYRELERVLAVLAAATKPASLAVYMWNSGPGPRGTPPPITSWTTARVVESVVSTKYAELRDCYTSALKREPKMAGTVVIRFTIKQDGKVGDAAGTDATTLTDESVLACMVGVYRKLVFPEPEDGKMTVVFPLQFSPD